MANKTTGIIYQHVINEVISAIQGEFEDHGVDEAVLQELQRSWEAKLIESRVAEFPGMIADDEEETAAPASAAYYEAPASSHRASAADKQAPVTPYDQEYQPPPSLPTADDDATAAASALPSYNPHTLGQVMPGGPSSAAHLANIVSSATAAEQQQHSHQSQPLPQQQQQHHNHQPLQGEGGFGQPQPYYQPRQAPGSAAPGPSNHPPVGGHQFPQHDGADDDEVDDDSGPSTVAVPAGHQRRQPKPSSVPRQRTAGTLTLTFTQVDGEDEDAEEDEDGALAAEENDEDAINSDLDDSDEEDVQNEEGGGAEDTEHIILCQYDKVSRQKNRWKCVLKDGILLIDGKDYLFHKGTGEFEW
ncbi:transcription factor IIA subunit alpha [Tieghemiomyces parasiticus]|uniref:Transcription initiation factor IIA large subunit n=1 Tax=Tieghemiomyces parasiticus TaxID=78921 RepID=A0A9W8AFL1_9FUNG|nr:transcription factor IIA subunit alpha [Tieghemiomyces parasiticus]